MQVLTELPISTRERTEKYPWADWFDGVPRLLEEGIDYFGTTSGFRSCAYAAARRHAVKIAVRTLTDGPDGEGLAIQSQ
mgnify:FL=1